MDLLLVLVIILCLYRYLYDATADIGACMESINRRLKSIESILETKEKG